MLLEAAARVPVDSFGGVTVVTVSANGNPELLEIPCCGCVNGGRGCGLAPPPAVNGPGCGCGFDPGGGCSVIGALESTGRPV